MVGQRQGTVAVAPRSLALATAVLAAALGAAPALPFEHPATAWHPRWYCCPATATPPVIDGRLDDAVWRLAPWTEDFVDIEGEARPVAPRHRTRAKLLWDRDALYIAAELEEPHVWGTLTERDAVLFHDNDFEVFLDPDGDNHLYAELEVNALGTVWDLLLVRPYRDGGPALSGWDIAGLVVAVHVDGTLNDPADLDRGWTVEIALPWAALAELAGARACPPEPGDTWRLNLSRVQWEHRIEDGRYVKTPVEGRGWIGEDNWVWSPQGLVAMHAPERWGFVTFVATADAAGSAGVTGADGATIADPRPLARPGATLLMPLYYAQRGFHAGHGRFAGRLADLGAAGLLPAGVHGELSLARLTLTAGPDTFHAVLQTVDGTRWTVDHTGRLTCEGSCP
jgi:hypothetical protein